MSTNYIIGEPEFIFARMTYCLLQLGSRGHYICGRPVYGHVNEKLMDNFYTLLFLKICKQLLAFGRWVCLIVSCVSLEMGNTVSLSLPSHHIARTSPTLSWSNPQSQGRSSSRLAGSKCFDLLWVEINACIARLIICARHLVHCTLSACVLHWPDIYIPDAMLFWIKHLPTID